MDDARELRQQGIRAAKAGQKDEARRLLQQSLRLEPDSEPAWLWLASVAGNNRERVFCLNKVLEVNPHNETALKALESLSEPPPVSTTVQQSTSATPAPPARAAIDDLLDQQPGIPVPSPDRIASAQEQVETIMREYFSPLPKRANWVRKTSGRAGERDIILYRIQVAVAAIVVLVILGAAGVYAVQTNDQLRYVVLGPSATPTPSPTITPTFTPGYSATPSSTPRVTLTPSPSVPPNVPAASPPAMPRVTEVYPEVKDRLVFDSVMLLDQGNAPRAVQTLEGIRQQNYGTTFNPSVYYYEAIALAEEGDFTTALQTLQEADGLVGDRAENIAAYRPVLDAAYAKIYALQAERALDNGNVAVADQALPLMRERAQAAVEGDSKLAEPYLLLAEDRVRNRRYADAIEILNQGLAVSQLAGNTNLIMEKANIYYAQRNYDAALYQLFLVLYIDPSIEAAYQLKVQIGFDRNRPGDAVLAAEDYLYYFPGATRAYRLLGDAYMQENKPDLALSIYTRGLSGRTTDADSVAMLEARAGIYRTLGEADSAITDYTRLFEITNDASYRAQRMQTAVQFGRYADALNDAEALANSPNIPQGTVNFVRGLALVASSDPGDTARFQQAESFLRSALDSPELANNTTMRGAAYESLAQAQFELNDDKAALESIESSIALGETGSRRYWRGRINEASNQPAAAIRDYEFVLAWSQIYPYAFRGDAEEHLNALRQ